MVYLVTPTPTNEGIIQYKWISPDEVVHDFSFEVSKHMFVPRGTKGLGNPNVDITKEKLPFAPGEIVRYITQSGTTISLPLILSYSTIDLLMLYSELLRGWFDTGNEKIRQPGQFCVIGPDGVERRITAYYIGGLEGDMNSGAPNWYPVVIQLFAPDPAWTDAEETEYIYNQAEIGNQQSFINNGTYEAYPIWKIDGPVTSVRITNSASNKFFDFSGNGGVVLTAGDSLFIDTRPAHLRQTLSVYDSDGVSQYNHLLIGSQLWTLISGQNTINMQVGGTSSLTKITLTFAQRYRGVLR